MNVGRVAAALVIAAALRGASVVAAPSLERGVLGCGGGASAGGGLSALGSIGQPFVGWSSDAGGGSGQVCSGWWCVERGSLVSVPADPSAPEQPTSFANPRPSPTRGAVALAFHLARAGQVTVDVFDVSGARTARLLSGVLGAGPHEARWDGSGREGRRCVPGVYFVAFGVEGRVVARRRVVLLR